MKRSFKSLVLAFGFGTLLAATSLSAQTNSAVADIPFSFMVGGHLQNAGTYNFSQLSLGSATFLLRNQDGQARFTQLASREMGNPTHPSVTFARYNGEWVLVKITPPDSAEAYSVGSKMVPSGMHLAALVSVKLK